MQCTNWWAAVQAEKAKHAGCNSETPTGGLAKLLGPQWKSLLALFRSEAVGSHSAGGRAEPNIDRIVAVDAANHAAIAAGRGEQLLAAVHLATVLGQSTNRAAARDAVRGLVVADLVGHHGLSSAHVECLLAVWARTDPAALAEKNRGIR